MNPAAVLQERYPQYDCALYFDLLKYFRTTPKAAVTQRHHILPRAQFPEFKDFKKFPENRIMLAVREHVQAHLLLEALTCGAIWNTPPQWIASAGSEKQRAALKIAMGTPEARARNAAAQKIAQNRPEVKARNSASHKIAQNRPEARARHSAVMKKCYENPQQRERHAAAMKKYFADNPEARTRLSTAQKITAQRPEVRARRTAALKKYFEDPEARARNAVAQKKRFEDPEARKSAGRGPRPGAHIFWHVKRGVISPKCVFCSQRHVTPDAGADPVQVTSPAVS